MGSVAPLTQTGSVRERSLERPLLPSSYNASLPRDECLILIHDTSFKVMTKSLAVFVLSLFLACRPDNGSQVSASSRTFRPAQTGRLPSGGASNASSPPF